MFSAFSSYIWGEQNASPSVLPEAVPINVSSQALINAKKSLKPPGCMPVRDFSTGCFLRDLQKAKMALKPVSFED
tara:strand:+ start:715 stop:939 length:225 start_codon:yes stop_codon:yes gene_type:complete